MLLKWQACDQGGNLLSSQNLEIREGSMHAMFDADGKILGKISGTMEFPVSHHEAIFMNGYQTWTVCPEYEPKDKIRGLHGVPRFLLNRYSFDRYGDYHFAEYPNRKGVLHGHSWCTFRRGGYYKLIASLDERPGYTMFTIDCEANVLTIERDCSGVKGDDAYHAFDLFYAEGSEQEVYDAWFHAMNIKPRTMQQIAGYSSWYNRYENINEEAIMQDLAGCREIFVKNDLFQIDDGWEPAVGDWIADEAKFPCGMKEMADRIHDAGFRAGIWLAPFVAEKESALFQQHPDWFLMVDGKPWKNGCNWSGFYSLDIDHPEVVEYLRSVFDTVLNKWGYDLVKLDFLYGAAPFGNEKESRAGRMYRAMKLLRTWCGDKLILGCGVPVMPAFGLVDYCRISCDVTLDWDDKFFMRMFHRERTSTKNAVANILSRRSLNGRAYLSDPDVFFLREDNIRLSEGQKDSLAVLDALCGGVFLTSDDPSSYTEEMKKKYRMFREMMNAEDVMLRKIGDSIEAIYRLKGRSCRIVLFDD